MINSYFRSTAPKPSLQSYYTTTRIPPEKPTLQLKYKKYKLIILILTRTTHKTLKLTLDAINENSKSMASAITKITQLSEKNIGLTLYLAFDKIKIASSQQRTDQKILKNAINLLQRIERYKLKQSFSKLIL